MSHQAQEIVYFQCASEFSICFPHARIKWHAIFAEIPTRPHVGALSVYVLPPTISGRRRRVGKVFSIPYDFILIFVTRLDILLKCNKSWCVTKLCFCLRAKFYNLLRRKERESVLSVLCVPASCTFRLQEFLGSKCMQRWWTSQHHSTYSISVLEQKSIFKLINLLFCSMWKTRHQLVLTPNTAQHAEHSKILFIFEFSQQFTVHVTQVIERISPRQNFIIQKPRARAPFIHRRKMKNTK